MPHFFATAADLLPVFSHVEMKRDLTYTRTGHLLSQNVVSYGHGSELPTLYLPAPCESAVNCPAYLVAESDHPITLRELPLYEGKQRWAVDQLCNPNTIVISHGGLYEMTVLLNGRVATDSHTRVAQSLQRSFASAMKKEFVRIKSFYVGLEAAALLDRNFRLTMAEQSPREYDLAR